MTTTTQKLSQPADDRMLRLEDEMRATRRELAALRQLIDHFCGVFLNSQFPYGKATDRWAK